MARAVPQLSIRQPVGGGARWERGKLSERVFETGLRGEVLFGPARVDVWRAGLAVELRSADFDTVEAAMGAATLWPVAAGFPVTLSAALGWCSRGSGRDGPVAVGTITLGYRAFNHESIYGYGLSLYATGRRYVGDVDAGELSAGVEIDLAFIVAIPAIFAWELISKGDPDES